MTTLHPRHHAHRFPDRPALILADDDTRITYRELVENADRCAQLFAGLGIGEGDTIAIFLENHIRYPEICWAAKNSGIRYACISSQSNAADAAYIARDSGATLLISSNALAPTALDIAKAVGNDVHLLMLDGAEAPFRAYEALLRASDPVPPQDRHRGPSMLYSSGTTGRPKGVKTAIPDAPPETPPSRLTMLRERYGLDEDSRLVCPGPFYHAAPGRFMMSVQRCGGTMIAFRRFDPEGVLAAIDRHQATHGLFVPTMFVRMLRLEEETRQSYSHSSLRCVVHLAAPCPVHVKQAMIDWWGPIIEEMYGGTEAIGHTLIDSHEWLAHKGSVGRPAPGCSVRILDDNGETLLPNATGLVYMYNGLRFEYHNDPEKTREAINEDGWGTLGDIGYMDDDGYLYLVDRKSHTIVSGGVNIYPQEAENVLSGHPAVADVAVIGVPNEDFGEEVKAIIVPRRYPPEDADALAKELDAFCRQHLSSIKCPRSISFAESLPRNEAGKLVKRLIKAQYWEGHDTRIV